MGKAKFTTIDDVKYNQTQLTKKIMEIKGGEFGTGGRYFPQLTHMSVGDAPIPMTKEDEHFIKECVVVNHPDKFLESDILSIKIGKDDYNHAAFFIEHTCSCNVCKRKGYISWQRLLGKKGGATLKEYARSLVNHQIDAYHKDHSTCEVCGSYSSFKETHHVGKTFNELFLDFIEDCKKYKVEIPNEEILIEEVKPDSHGRPIIHEKELVTRFSSAWRKRHLDKAVLKTLCQKCHDKVHSKTVSDVVTPEVCLFDCKELPPVKYKDGDDIGELMDKLFN